jgi:hypothetical protein
MYSQGKSSRDMAATELEDAVAILKYRNQYEHAKRSEECGVWVALTAHRVSRPGNTYAPPPMHAIVAIILIG